MLADAIVVVVVNVRGGGGSDEELGAVGVLSSVGHGHETLFGVLELEVLVRELSTVDCHHQHVFIYQFADTYLTFLQCHRPW